LKVTTPRKSGVSPFLMFFDATATTDSAVRANMTAFQDVTYSWTFGDSNASGAGGTWAYGSNAGHNTKNTATGGVAAHLYVTTGADTSYTVTVKAYDGTNTATCQLEVTAYDPAGANGFPGSGTTCVSATGTPTPGSGGCPAGAAVLNTSSFATALSTSHLNSGKQVLFKCGDTFTGDNVTVNATKWSIGAYGGCQGTQSGRPIFTDSGSAGELMVGYSASDGRISDIDFEGNGSGAHAVWTPAGNSKINNQITLNNLYSNGNTESYGYSQGAQWGIIDSVVTGEHNIAVFLNYNENNPTTWSGNAINNVNYAAVLGNSFNGTGAPDGAGGVEVLRISACRMCVIENNTVENANDVAAVLKLHNGNTDASLPTWTGVYTEFVEISDNVFTGTSGAQIVENAPQNAGDDERLRDIVVERNLFSATTGVQGGRLLMVSAVNESVRDNAFYMPGNSSEFAAFGMQIAQRGVEPVPTGVESYNNTCYAPSNTGSSQTCVEMTGAGGMASPATNSFVQNNLYYIPAGGQSTVVNQGTGNTVSNNTASPSSNPGFVDASGSFKLISDFQPTANYLGGTAVPAFFDALALLWPVWDLGAVAP
jgi:hypothetical protein